MDSKLYPPNPPPPEVHKDPEQQPIHFLKKCSDCRLSRPVSAYSPSRRHLDRCRPSCKDCFNQSSRFYKAKIFGYVNGPRDEDSYIRNVLHHNRAFLRDFFHSTDYGVQGVAFHIESKTDLTFSLKRIPNTSIVELRLTTKDNQDYKFVGVDRLKEDAVEELCACLREYRLESTATRMQMAKLYIYDRP